MSVESGGIADAIAALQGLLDKINANDFQGWHLNPVDGSCLYERTNDTPDGAAVTLVVNPATDPPTVQMVSVQFVPAPGGVQQIP